MPNLIDKMKSGAASLVRGVHKMVDSTNVDSQVGLRDVVGNDKETRDYLRDDYKKLIKLGDKRFEEARIALYKHREEIFSGLALFKGNHREYWDDNQGKLVSVIPDNATFSQRFIFKTIPIARTLIERCQSRILAERPDAWGAPLTDSELDRAAAACARAVNAHCNRVSDMDQLLEDVVLQFLITTTVFVECGWDNKAYADIGLPQPDGTIKYHYAQVGDFYAKLIPSINGYPDPNAGLSNKGIDGGAYFITRTLRPVADGERQWGKLIPAMNGGDQQGWYEQQIAWISDDYSTSFMKDNHCYVETRVWEKCSPQFPDGRYWVYTGDMMLWANKWPYEYKKDSYPYVEFYYQKNSGSVWGLNAIGQIADNQLSLNKLATYLNGRMEWDQPTVSIERNSGIAPDSLINPHYGKVSTRKVGSRPPDWIYPQNPGAFYFEYGKMLRDDSEYIIGVRDFNSDSAPAPNSGKEYELRMQEDKARLATCIRRTARGMVKIMEWQIALYRQFGASFPRLLGLDDQSIPAQDLSGGNAAVTAMHDITALQNGQCRVVLSPGSGEGKLPAAQDERLDEVVALIAKLPAALAEFYLNELNNIRSDAQVERLITELKQMEAAAAAAQPNPQAIEQQKADAAMQLEQMKNQADLQKMQAEAQIDIQKEAQKSAIAVHSASLAQTWRMQADLAVQNQKFQHDTALANQVVPKVSIAVNAGPKGTAAAEQLAGFPLIDDPATLAAIMAPKPAPTKGKSDGQS